MRAVHSFSRLLQLMIASTCIAVLTVPAAANVPPALACSRTVAHYQEGKLVEWLCESEAQTRKLTIVDLGDDWVPLGFRDGDGVQGPSYRETYLALARQDPDATTDPRTRELGFYGVFSTLGRLSVRIQDKARQSCNAAVEKISVDGLPKRLVEENRATGRKRVQSHVRQRAALELQMRKRGLSSLEELSELGGYHQKQVAALAKRELRTQFIRVVQEHLLCEGDSSDVALDGVLSWRTTRALRIYQRRYFLPPTGWIEANTVSALQSASAHEDWRGALRVLRERVIDATGLIEDGSASNKLTPVVGQILDPQSLVWPRGYEAAKQGAPDLIGTATNRAAVELGWTSPEALLSFFKTQKAPGKRMRVALSLPKLPSYYSKHMKLRVEIDLGTNTSAKQLRRGSLGRRPALLLFVGEGTEERLLVRWPTTIGGWQDERLSGGAVVERFKPSDTGDFVWKDLYMAPRWLPPKSTPDTDVLKKDHHGKWVLDPDVLGPSFRSAYGLAMLILHRPYRYREEIRFGDQGIRVHGTGNILSLGRGTSHGCHRLLGFQVMRLSAFLLGHRQHVRVGPEPVSYSRVFRQKGLAFPVNLKQRGYRFEFTPPLAVRVSKKSK